MEKNELEMLSDDEIIDFASEIGERYTRALHEAGLSTSTHIAEIDLRFLSQNKQETYSFLERASRYYFSLNTVDRIFFVNEILEPGRTYPFWYMDYFTPRTFRSKKVSACREALAAI